jgi:hypothetical protein
MYRREISTLTLKLLRPLQICNLSYSECNKWLFSVSLLFEKSFPRTRPSDISDRPKAPNEFARLGESLNILFSKSTKFHLHDPRRQKNTCRVWVPPQSLLSRPRPSRILGCLDGRIWIHKAKRTRETFSPPCVNRVFSCSRSRKRGTMDRILL